jgi:subtilisin
MKTKIFVLIVSCLIAVSVKSKAVETPASDKAAGLERVPVLIGFTQVPGPSEQALVRSKGGLIKHSFHLVPAIAASIPEVAIEGLLHNPNVTNVEPDIKVYAVDAELDNSWGVKRIGAGTAHDAGSKGLGVKVAIIDSGIDTTHPDLAANYVGGYDFVNDDDDPMDDAGHGTHVAGTVAAEDNGAGVVGVAPEADLYALKVLDSDGSGYYSDVIAALQWAVANGIQVTNNSYGSSGDPGPIVKAAFDLVEAAGILNVCAAGNRGRPSGSGDNVIYPARFESCVAVAATDKTDIRASFSSTGQDVEIAAPGVYVKRHFYGLSTCGGDSCLVYR